MSELQRTKEWFEQAILSPTIQSACVQIGCAYEETSELAMTLGDTSTSLELTSLADAYKSAEFGYMREIELMSKRDKTQMLDDIVDEIVTRVGIAHCMGFDIVGALDEVNRSNFSKFENGKPVFNANGKIAKGKNYTPPQLAEFIGDGK